MNNWSLVHLLGSVVSLLVGLVLVSLRKGDRRHRLLGWTYVVSMLLGLVAILVRTREHPRPFAGYAVFMVLVLVAAVGASRARHRLPAWRAWHGSLMSLTMLGAVMAALSIGGGVLIGAGNGPPFYRMFNLIIAVVTLLGLALAGSRPVLWGRLAQAPERRARWHGAVLVLASSGALILAQWSLAYP